MRTHTTITVQGDQDYVQAVKALAAVRGIKIGTLVREAIDSKYGSDLSIFFDEVARQNVQENAPAKKPANQR